MRLARRGLVLASCAGLASGCSLLSPVKSHVTTYVLDALPAGSPRQPTRAASVLVLPVEAAPAYATRRMAYSTQPHQLAYFNESEWLLPPPAMLQPLLVEALRRSGFFDEVASGTAPRTPAFVLRAEILELKQDFTSELPVLRLVLRVSLSRAGQHVATREFSAAQAMRERTARAGVAAANEALEKLLREIVEAAARAVG